MQRMADEGVKNKLVAARTRLIIERPFLGTLVLRLPLEAANPQWCKTTATDARKIFYNAQYVAQLDIDQTQYVLAHEALHCALSHFARRQHREKHRWDVACDYAINPLLVNDGLKPPPGILLEDGFEGMTAEEIYPSIEENCDDVPMDRHVYDEQDQADKGRGNGNQKEDRPPGQAPQTQPRSQSEPQPKQPSKTEAETKSKTANGGQNDVQSGGENAIGASQPSPLTKTEQDNLDTQWQQRLAGAAQTAMQAGKLGGALARIVEHFLQPQLPWRNLLAQFVSSVARDDYSYARPSSRRGDPVVYPSLRSGQINVVVGLDTSGSISDRELSEFLTEIDAIKAHMRARIVFHACDSVLADDGPWTFEPWEEFVMPMQFEGGGGTDFNPLFEWVDQQDVSPDLLVYFTDAEGEFPAVQPNYPVVWLVKGKAKVPWGRRVQLN